MLNRARWPNQEMCDTPDARIRRGLHSLRQTEIETGLYRSMVRQRIEWLTNHAGGEVDEDVAEPGCNIESAQLTVFELLQTVEAEAQYSEELKQDEHSSWKSFQPLTLIPSPYSSVSTFFAVSL